MVPYNAMRALVVQLAGLAFCSAGCTTYDEFDGFATTLSGGDTIDDFGASPGRSAGPDTYGPETCDAGIYPPAPPPKCTATSCFDNNPCTQDLCAPASGCYFPPQNEGKPCTDSYACTTGATCIQGQCGTAAIGPIDVGPGAWAVPVGMDDGGAVLIGASTTGVNQPNKLWTQRVDADGELMWSRDWDIGVGQSSLTKALPAPQGGVYIAGTSTYASTSKNDAAGKRPWLARLDAAGGITWELNGPSPAGSAVAAAPLADGSIALLSAGGLTSPHNRLLRATPDGKWLPAIELPDAVTAVAFALAVESTATVLVLARSYHIEADSIVEDGTLVWRIDHTGQLLAAFAWPYELMGYASAIAADGSGFWLAGSVRSANSKDPQAPRLPYLDRYDTAGQLLWRRVTGDAPGYSPAGLALLPDGAVATFATQLTSGPAWPILSYYNSTGTLTWRNRPTATLSQAYGFAPRADGWMWTDRTMPGDSPMRIRWIRADAWGHDDCTAAGACLDLDVQDCPGGDACSGPQCSPASGCLPSGTNVPPASQCDDGNACTVDSCDLAGGCTHTNALMGSACNDDSVCTSGDHCAAGLCIAAMTDSCSDGNPCTQDSCSPQTGCHFKVLPDGAPCDDGLACTVGGECLLGKCGAAVVWRKGLLPGETGGVAGLFPGPADGLVAVGYAGLSGSSPRPVAIGLSAAGTPLWTRSGTALPGLQLNSAIRLSDGSVWAAGIAGSQGADVALVRWLPDLSEAVVTSEATAAVDAADAMTPAAEGFMLAGHRDGQAWVQLRSAAGAVQWSKTVLSAKVLRVGALAALPSGEWTVAVDVQSPVGGQVAAVAMRFASDGELLWQSPPDPNALLRAMALVGPVTLTVGGQPPPFVAPPFALWRAMDAAGKPLTGIGFGDGAAVQLLGSDGAWQLGVLRLGKAPGDWEARVFVTAAEAAMPPIPGQAPTLQAVILKGGSGERFSLIQRANGWDVAAGAGPSASPALQGQLFAWQVARTGLNGGVACQ